MGTVTNLLRWVVSELFRKPGDFPVGSLESRAAARAMLKQTQNITHVMISTGLPAEFSNQEPIVTPPDSVAYYREKDDSVVQVVYREYERGRFTAFIDQTWQDGSVYYGDCRIEHLSDLPTLRMEVDN